MPRQTRYFIPGYPQHVIQRGVNRQAVFFRTEDYARYLRTLAGSAGKEQCDIHAYVLMTNHVHLLVTPRTSRSLPRLLQAIGREYVQAINRMYDRTGPLWQGRYKASLIESERYLLACYRYIELNPVRAGMVASPDDYPFSSYRANGLGVHDPVLVAHDVYLALGANGAERRAQYRAFFRQAPDRRLVKKIRETTNACRVLGCEHFKDQIEALLGKSVRPGQNGRPGKST
jgi:putative transposase